MAFRVAVPATGVSVPAASRHVVSHVVSQVVMLSSATCSCAGAVSVSGLHMGGGRSSNILLQLILLLLK